MTEATGRYFEDYAVGDVIETGQITVSDSEVIAFARQFDPQPFHIDPEAAKQSIFGRLAASGFHTLGLTFRLVFDTGILNGTNLGSGGAENLKWLRPVYPGDSLHARLEVIEARPSRSASDRGNLRIRYVTFNQDDEPVMEVTFHHLVRRRSPCDSAS